MYCIRRTCFIFLMLLASSSKNFLVFALDFHLYNGWDELSFLLHPQQIAVAGIFNNLKVAYEYFC